MSRDRYPQLPREVTEIKALIDEAAQYFNGGDTEKAQEVLKKALRIAQKLGLPEDAIILYLDTGNENYLCPGKMIQIGTPGPGKSTDPSTDPSAERWLLGYFKRGKLKKETFLYFSKKFFGEGGVSLEQLKKKLLENSKTPMPNLTKMWGKGAIDLKKRGLSEFSLALKEYYTLSNLPAAQEILAIEVIKLGMFFFGSAETFKAVLELEIELLRRSGDYMLFNSALKLLKAIEAIEAAEAAEAAAAAAAEEEEEEEEEEEAEAAEAAEAGKEGGGIEGIFGSHHNARPSGSTGEGEGEGEGEGAGAGTQPYLVYLIGGVVAPVNISNCNCRPDHWDICITLD